MDRQPRFVVRCRRSLRGRRWRWTLVAPNGEVVATSEAYGSLAGCCHSIHTVRVCGPAARIEVLER